MLDLKDWKLRDDTFPSNRALFTKCNFRQRAGRAAEIMLQREETPVRSFTSAAIASRRSYLYCTFSADIRPSNVSGLITGIFLHRNGPRQEIDIEFLGKDTTKLLVNVYFNPGGEGTKLEYGYRGTPTIINLGSTPLPSFIITRLNGARRLYGGAWMDGLRMSAPCGVRRLFRICRSSLTSTSGTLVRPSWQARYTKIGCLHSQN